MRRYHIIWIALIVLWTAACGSPQQQQGLTASNSTATPVSTPLPSVPTAIPPGAEGNPIRMVLRPVSALADDEREAAAAALTALIQDKTGLVLEIVTVNRYAEALAALCDSGKSQVSIAWLDGPGYTAAAAQTCGQPALQVRRGTSREIDTGASGQLIMTRELGTTELNALGGRVFCRLGEDDFFSWLLPLLVLKAQGLDLLTLPEQVVDYPDIPMLISAVANGDCAAAGVPEDSFQVYADEISEDMRDQLRVVLTTVPFPFGVLMYPSGVQLGVRLALNDALVDIAASPDSAETMRVLLGQDSLIQAEPDDFAEMLTFMNSTGLDFAQLGN